MIEKESVLIIGRKYLENNKVDHFKVFESHLLKIPNREFKVS